MVNLCEMKFADEPYAITAAYEDALVNKRAVFTRETKTRKAVHLTLVSPEGIKRNAHWGAVQETVNLDDLLWKP